MNYLIRLHAMKAVVQQESSPVQQEEEPLKQEEATMKESMKVPVNDPRKIEALEETLNATNRSFEALSVKVSHTLETIMKQLGAAEVVPEVVEEVNTLKVVTGKGAKASKEPDEDPEEGDDEVVQEDQIGDLYDLDTRRGVVEGVQLCWKVQVIYMSIRGGLETEENQNSLCFLYKSFTCFL